MVMSCILTAYDAMYKSMIESGKSDAEANETLLEFFMDDELELEATGWMYETVSPTPADAAASPSPPA